MDVDRATCACDSLGAAPITGARGGLSSAPPSASRAAQASVPRQLPPTRLPSKAGRIAGGHVDAGRKIARDDDVNPGRYGRKSIVAVEPQVREHLNTR